MSIYSRIQIWLARSMRRLREDKRSFLPLSSMLIASKETRSLWLSLILELEWKNVQKRTLLRCFLMRRKLLFKPSKTVLDSQFLMILLKNLVEQFASNQWLMLALLSALVCHFKNKLEPLILMSRYSHKREKVKWTSHTILLQWKTTTCFSTSWSTWETNKMDKVFSIKKRLTEMQQLFSQIED